MNLGCLLHFSLPFQQHYGLSQGTINWTQYWCFNTQPTRKFRLNSQGSYSVHYWCGHWLSSLIFVLFCKGRFTQSMPFPCRAHAVPLPCRAAKGLECVFPIWFTQCVRVWFTLAMPWPCHAPTIPLFSRPQQSTAVERRPCSAVALRITEWSEHGMGMAWQVWIRHDRTV
jgi:hypothetical protein